MHTHDNNPEEEEDERVKVSRDSILAAWMIRNPAINTPSGGVTIMAALSAASTLKLNDGTVIPRIGFGVYQIRGMKCAAAARINHECGAAHHGGLGSLTVRAS